MNFLAHVFLSGTDTSCAIGNLIADRLKGNKFTALPIEIQKGVYLHRAIDQYTDQHTIVKTCVSELFPVYRHYSRVIVDMYFDHFLAANWNDYHELSLKDFSQNFYKNLEVAAPIFSESIQKFIQALIRYNWFEHYSSLTGLETILIQMEKHTKFPSKLGESTKELIEKYPYFKNHFFKFMNELIVFTKTKIKDL